MPPQISQFFNTHIPFLDEAVFIFKIISAIISAGMFGFIIWALIKTTWLKRMYLWDMQELITDHPHGVKKLYKPWQKIKIRLEAGIETDYKLAVIEADSMLENILKDMGFAGDNLSQRLDKLTGATMPNLADILEVHKIRNSIVHDPDYRLTLDNAKKALEVYEEALTHLQAL